MIDGIKAVKNLSALLNGDRFDRSTTSPRADEPYQRKMGLWKGLSETQTDKVAAQHKRSQRFVQVLGQDVPSQIKKSLNQK